LHPDAERWNARYKSELEYYIQREPYSLVTSHSELIPDQGIVLDAAAGVSPLGCFLAQRGLTVFALDISLQALLAARQRAGNQGHDLACAVMDLMDPWLAPSFFSAIFNFYFLSRPLIDRYRSALKPGGYVFCEMLLWDERIGLDKQNYLQPGELERRFSDWRMHFRDEIWKYGRGHNGQPRKVVQMIAQKPLESD
jgi:SAM-dependent methyltransferase